MTAALLLREFDRLSEAPDAVSRCRQAILELAVQGRLTTRLSTDVPAREILDGRTLTPAPTDVAWALPSGWAWTSLRLVGEQFGGGTPSKTTAAFWDGTIPWVSPKDMKVERIAESRDHVSDAALNGSAARLIPAGAILMVVRGMILAHSFPVALTEVPLTINQDIKAVVPFTSDIAPILLLTLKGLKRRILTLVERSTHGTCRLPTACLFDLPIPVPPLEEQRRIVSKVDELMTVCDELDTAQQQRERRRKQLSGASIARLTAPVNAPGKMAGKDVIFFLSHASRMVTRAEHVADVRRVILDLAVRGRLAETDYSTGNPSTIEDVCSLVVDGDHNPPPRVAIGIPYVTARNVTDRGLELISASRVSTNEWTSGRLRYRPEEDDVLITCVGTLGRTAIVGADREFLIDRNVAAMRPNEHVLARYLKVALDAPSTHAFLISASGSTAQPHIYLKDLRRTKVRIPCRDEQRRIVAKVDALMEVCDELEASLAAADSGRARALETVLYGVLEETGVPLSALLDVTA